MKKQVTLTLLLAVVVIVFCVVRWKHIGAREFDSAAAELSEGTRSQTPISGSKINTLTEEAESAALRAPSRKEAGEHESTVNTGVPPSLPPPASSGDQVGTPPSVGNPVAPAPVSGTQLASSPNWVVGTEWRVQYKARRVDANQRIAYETSTATYTVIGQTTITDNQSVPVDVIRLRFPERKHDFLLTYRSDSKALVNVEEEGSLRPLLHNDYGDESMMPCASSLAEIAVFDCPRFPLLAGSKAVVDPERKESLALAEAATVVVDPGLPGGKLNPTGFTQTTGVSTNQGELSVTFSRSDPAFGFPCETRITYDGGGWWKAAETRMNGEVVVTGERL